VAAVQDRENSPSARGGLPGNIYPISAFTRCLFSLKPARNQFGTAAAGRSPQKAFRRVE
jgi:hypothetical protein